MGKSWLALGLALAIAKGEVAPESTQVEVGEVLYLALEDSERRLQQRLRQVLPRDGSELGLKRLLFCRQRRTTRAEVVARREAQRGAWATTRRPRYLDTSIPAERYEQPAVLGEYAGE